MNKTDDYTSLSISSKGRVFLHIHENKLFLFYCDCKYKKFFGYEVKIKELNGLSPKQLVSHEYKNLHIRFNSTTSSDVDICILLALKDSDNDIYLKEMDASGIRYKSLCNESNSNKNGTIISSDERDYLDLDPYDYDQLFLLGYDGRIALPAAVLDNVRELKSLDGIVYAYFQNCSSELTEFVQWIGLENAKNYRVRGYDKNNSILDIAVMECQYSVVEYLVRQGLHFNAFISDRPEIIFYSKTQVFFHTFDNLCSLLESRISDFTIKDLYMMMLHFLEGIGRFSRLVSNLVPNPSIESIRELDDMFCSYFERISKCMPDEVFSLNTDNRNCILAYAVRALNLFPKCFKKVLDKSSPEDYHFGEHNIFHEFLWDRSGDISPSWLIYDLLIPYRLMTNDEKYLFIGNGKLSTEIGIDSQKAEAGALLMQLICKWLEIVGHDEKKGQLVDTQIFKLLNYVGPDFVNPQGVTPLLQAIIADITDVNFYRKMFERGVDLNKKDIFGRCPLVESLSPYKMSVFNLLLENGADTDVLNTENNAVCELAADQNWGLHFFEEDWHVFDSINDKSFLTALGKDGKSPFLLALEARNLGAIRYLGKGGYVRPDEMPQILEVLSKIRNSDVRKEIVNVIQRYQDKKSNYSCDCTSSTIIS